MNDDDVTEIMGGIRDLSAAIYPGKSICGDCQTWHHSHSTDHSKSCQFSVGILPGLDGSKCQRFRFATIAEVREWIENHKRNSVTV